MSVSLLGFCWDASSSYARGPAQAPHVIRAALTSEASNPYSYSGIHFEEAVTNQCFPELPADAAAARKKISETVSETLDAEKKPLSLGGDHSITYPILEALHAQHGPMNILHIDAHPDMYESFEGDPYSHACPFRRAIEDGYINNLVQLGLRSVSPEQRAFGSANGVVMLGADGLEEVPLDQLTAPLYISIDLDGLDPAFAPGVSHPEPGGLSTREVLGLLSKLPAEPVGADIVELNPEKDIGLATANIAARLAKELAAMMTAT